MEYKKAIDILLKIQKTYNLKQEEKEALQTAIGTLDCGSLAKNRFKMIIKSCKAKKEKQANF